VEQKVDAAEFLAGDAHQLRDLLVAGDVHRLQERDSRSAIGELRHAAEVLLPLVIRLIGHIREAAVAAFAHDPLSNRPGDRLLVKHAGDDAALAGK